jgi:hypothetical protein
VRPRPDEPRHETGDAPLLVEQHAAVAIELTIGDESERHERAGCIVRGGDCIQVDVGERVAVDDEETIGADERQRLPRTAGAAEHRRLLPGVAHAGVEIAAVADDRGDRLGAMMQVQDELGHALRDEPADDPPDHRLARDRQRRLGAHVGQRSQACAEAGRQDDRDRVGRLVLRGLVGTWGLHVARRRAARRRGWWIASIPS